MKRLVYTLFLILLSVNLYAQNIGGPIVRGVEPKEPKVYGDPKLLDPFNNPDKVDEPYIEDPDMTRMELPFKEPEILFDRELQDKMLERYYEKEPEAPLSNNMMKETLANALRDLGVINGQGLHPAL